MIGFCIFYACSFPVWNEIHQQQPYGVKVNEILYMINTHTFAVVWFLIFFLASLCPYCCGAKLWYSLSEFCRFNGKRVGTYKFWSRSRLRLDQYNQIFRFICISCHKLNFMVRTSEVNLKKLKVLTTYWIQIKSLIYF